MTLGHTSKLRTTYLAAANQHGETVSPLMLLLVAYKVQSGAALPPEQGAVYGDGNTSEAELAARLARRQLPDSNDKVAFQSDASQAELLEETEFTKACCLP